MKIPILTTLAVTSMVSPLSAVLTLVDFSNYATWDASNPDPSTLTSTGGGPLVFNNVLNIPGCTVTIDFTGDFTGTDLVTGSVFDNRVQGSNTYTVAFGSVVDFQIEQTTHHGPDETDTLTVGGGTFDNTSFTILNDNVPVSSGPLPGAFSLGDTMFTAGPYPWNTGDTNTGVDHPEWTIDGTGSSFTYTHATAIGDGNNGFNLRNSFQFYIDTENHPPAVDPPVDPAVPEPGRAALLLIGLGVCLGRRNRRR